MKKLLVLVLLVSLCAAAQTPTKKDAKHAGKSAKGGGLTAALLQQEWDAWCTLDPANAAKYYDKAASDVFFDIAPLQYKGWDAYAKGVVAVLAPFKTIKANVLEPHIHTAGNLAWITSIVHLDTEMKDNSKGAMELRWTSVWEKRAGEWKIVHEHVSAPLPEPEKK